VPLRALSSVVNTAASLSPRKGQNCLAPARRPQLSPDASCLSLPILGECDAGYKWLGAVLK